MNSLDPDQARHNVGHDLNPNFLTLMVLLKEFFEIKKNHARPPSMQRVNVDGWILLSCLIQLFKGVSYVGISKLYVSLANTVVLRLGGFISNYQSFKVYIGRHKSIPRHPI